MEEQVRQLITNVRTEMDRRFESYRNGSRKICGQNRRNINRSCATGSSSRTFTQTGKGDVVVEPVTEGLANLSSGLETVSSTTKICSISEMEKASSIVEMSKVSEVGDSELTTETMDKEEESPNIFEESVVVEEAEAEEEAEEIEEVEGEEGEHTQEDKGEEEESSESEEAEEKVLEGPTDENEAGEQAVAEGEVVGELIEENEAAVEGGDILGSIEKREKEV